MIKYSIVIPTCSNELISMSLSYIEKLNKPKDNYEVIVIQNIDDKKIEEVVNSYNNKIPNLRFLKEENQGLVYCRHRGAKEAQGEIICYLDDDSFVDKNWLIEIEKTFLDSNVILAGGNNTPKYESTPPKWLKYFWNNTSYGKYMSELSLIEFNTGKQKVPTWFVFGCNFIIKKDAIFKYGGFNPDTIPIDKIKYRGDGETALSYKLNNEKLCAFFNPKIKIQHYVPNKRMTIEYLKKRGYCQGISDSFSKIRKEHGFKYYNLIDTNKYLKLKKPSFFIRKYNKIIKPLLDNFYKRIDSKNYKTFLYIKEEYKKAYEDGFLFHQTQVRNDIDLLKYVLQQNYM